MCKELKVKLGTLADVDPLPPRPWFDAEGNEYIRIAGQFFRIVWGPPPLSNLKSD